jgi:Ca2+-binding EF-hand superfamily protein
MSSVGSAGSGGYNPYAILQQTLFNQIDSNKDGSITQSELEKAVTSAGGASQAADALFTQLDPNKSGSVSEQQFSQNLPTPPLSDQMTSQLFGYQASALYTNTTEYQVEPGWTLKDILSGAHVPSFYEISSRSVEEVTYEVSGIAGSNPRAAFAQNLFSQIDANGDGSIGKSELERAVTAAGGTTQAADALFAKIDPNNTGSVSEQQLAQYLQPPSPTGNRAQDPLLALIDAASKHVSNASSTGAAGAVTGNTAQDALSALLQNVSANQNSSIAGNSAQDPLLALLQNFNPSESANGNAGQDPLLALLEGNGNSSTNGRVSQSNLLSAFSLYQRQISLQSFGGFFGTGRTGA